MCVSAAVGWLAANAGAIGAIGSAVGAVASLKAAGKKGPDPAAMQAQADATAAQSSNARLAQRRKSLAGQSLLTGGGDIMSSGILNGGKPTLGG